MRALGLSVVRCGKVAAIQPEHSIIVKCVKRSAASTNTSPVFVDSVDQLSTINIKQLHWNKHHCSRHPKALAEEGASTSSTTVPAQQNTALVGQHDVGFEKPNGILPMTAALSWVVLVAGDLIPLCQRLVACQTGPGSGHFEKGDIIEQQQWQLLMGSNIPRPTTWDVENHVDNGINYLSTGAGFLPSTISNSKVARNERHPYTKLLGLQFAVCFRLMHQLGAFCSCNHSKNLNRYQTKKSKCMHTHRIHVWYIYLHLP